MKLTTVKEIYREREKYLDQEITVGGWVRSVRDSKTFGFVVLHDGTYFETLQVVYHDTMDNFAEISKLNVGAAIIVKGTLVATPQAKQPFEIQATEISRLCSVYVPFVHMQSISSSRREDLSMYTHRLSQEATVRVLERCSRLRLWI